MPDLILLDLMMPGEDGLSICRRMREQSNIPIIILTARGDDIDRIIGLEVGADDYLPKPFNPRELLARIRAVMRRVETSSSQSDERLRVGSLTVNANTRTVIDEHSNPIELTAAEFDLFMCFAKRPSHVLTREQLMDWTGRASDVFDRSIDVQVSRLRKKTTISGVSLIKTERGVGYRLCALVKAL